MKIIADVPDECAPAVRETLEWIASRALLSSGEVLTICAGEDSRDCSLRVRLSNLAAVFPNQQAQQQSECPIEAVFPDERIPCTFPREHDGQHSFITPVPVATETTDA